MRGVHVYVELYSHSNTNLRRSQYEKHGLLRASLYAQ